MFLALISTIGVGLDVSSVAIFILGAISGLGLVLFTHEKKQ